MLYVTGDTHGALNQFEYRLAHSPTKLDSRDVLLIAGDFGFIFAANKEPVYLAAEDAALRKLETFPFTIAFCDGNHENFDRLNSFPTEVWGGAPVHHIAKNIVHLMRGYIYEIEGKSVFVFGGAYSIDKGMRTPGQTWWPQELPTNEEYYLAAESLKAHKNKVDIIFTHTAPQSVIYAMGSAPDMHDAELTGFLDWIWHEVDFDHWYFGHWHRDVRIHPKATGLFYEIVNL